MDEQMGHLHVATQDKWGRPYIQVRSEKADQILWEIHGTWKQEDLATLEKAFCSFAASCPGLFKNRQPWQLRNSRAPWPYRKDIHFSVSSGLYPRPDLYGTHWLGETIDDIVKALYKYCGKPVPDR